MDNILLKSKSLLVISFFLILQLAVLVPSMITPERGTNSFIGGACAQNDDPKLIGGNSCAKNYAKCPSGYTNYAEQLDNENFSINGSGLSPSTLVEQTYDQIGNQFNLEEVCVANNTNKYIRVLDAVGRWSGDLGLNVGTVGVSNIFVNSCAPGTNPTQGINSHEVAGGVLSSSKPWACCPSGFAFVNVKGSKAEWDSYNGACCRGSASEFSHFDGSCVRNDNTTISPSSQPSGSNGLEVIQQLNNGNGDILHTLGGNAIYLGTPMGPGAINSAINGPSMVFESGQQTGANAVCPEVQQGGCAIVDLSQNTGSATGVMLEGPSGNQTNLVVVDPNELNTNTDLSCTQCLGAGEAIAVQGEELLTCAGNGGVNRQELINGNVNDTLAFLAADPENQEQLKSCREQGGIYIAIGCIDPTPIGVITALIRIAFGVIGGVALIQLILAGIAYQSGDEEKIQEARSKIMATFSGLVVLVFSVLILRIIGVNVLDIIPGGAI